MKVGYIRVSTEEQNEARQEVLMDQLGVEKVFKDKLSGKNTDRPELKAMLNFMRDGDILVVESYSRLARSTVDLLKIIDALDEKGIGFISHKENIDTTTPQGRLMLTIFAGIYEFERECMLQRQKEGIAIAKAQGKYKGRKPIEVDQTTFETVYTEWKNGKIKAVEAMKKLNLSKPTFYRKVKEYENPSSEIQMEVV
ncbi:recombinase family protein [Acetobacterium woodii]|uniref:Resolvase n=1 Tax=Acetobacterium woodii (strain ATCC 29683 / DSM 1030 / JCM 2381 / KCTC 1655 / WB1) TaxID=931626 RepID=H6LFK7_ACEWD|nr:recombinase family protein [Acetobacterium woodii]AFA46952.1 resolvase [Acetobacterium woodii DSM 1030]